MAEVNNAPEVDDNNTTNTPQEPNTQTMDDVMQELARLKADLAAERADNTKNKAARDKLAKANGELTKSLRAKQTAEEQQAEADREKAEAEAQEHQELLDFKRRTLAKDRYLMQGMSVEMAAKAADAEIQGDMDLLSQIQKQVREADIEAELKAAKDKWIKERPQVNAGTGEDGASGITLATFNRMSYQQRVDFKHKYPDEYAKFTGK